ncbi:MAG: PKD domain-containing protein [Thermoplasmata archaeon]|nr:PKD domain-containing protein [Thermoplasmata archaeon]
MGGAVETSIFGDLIDINNISILHRGGNGGDGGDGGSPSDSVGGGGGGYGGGGAAGGWAPRDPGDTIVSDEVGAGGDSIVEVNATGSLFLFGRSNINSTGGSGGNGGIGGLEGGTGGGGGGGGYGGGGGGQDISGGGLNTLSGSIGHGGNSTVSLISPKPTISRKAEFFNYNGTGGIAPDSPGGGLGGGKGLGYITSKGIATTYVPMSIPLLLSPVNNSIHPITPTFEWLELHNSTINDPLSNYTIEFDDSNDFLSPALVNKTMMGNCTPTPPLPDGIYYWRVMANYSTPPTSTAGWSDVRVVTIGFDKTPPVISSVLVSNIGDASATITWTTDEPSDSTVNYSINSDLTSNSTVYDATMTTSHSVALTGLTPSTTYYFEVSSSDELNNTATDNNGLAYYSFTTTGDNSPPVSSVNSIDPYWHTTSTLDITASAYDSGNDVSNVTLWYSYSSDNALWGMNKSYAIDTTEPWGWVFDFPDGEGYYKFYSIANDTVDNTEDAPATADSSCAYDFTLPVITNNCPISGTTGDPYTFMAEAIDNFEIDEVWVVYEFGTGAVTNDTMIQSMADDYEVVIDVPLNSTDPIHYRILATDIAGISNSSYLGLVSILDNDAPVAHASHNPAVVEGTIVTLDGSDSVDNIGIDEYTWSFKDGAQDVTLHGAVSSYNFTISGNYTVTLNVQDAAGNNDIDTMTVTVEEILIDTDGDGIPDEDDDFPLDPSEDTDTDGDDIGNNADLDDDGDGYLDEWENFLGSDPLDQNDKPADADGDGIPDGDADNTESWMDTDDDGDGILDPDDIAPLDPPVTGNGGLAEYWWIILIIIIVLIVVVLIWYKNKGKKMSEAPVEETPVEEAFEDGEVLPPPYSPES